MVLYRAMELIILTLNTVGTLLIAWAVLSVHHVVFNEHEISSKVYQKMKAEQFLTVIGIVFIIISYVLEVFF